MLVRLCAVRVCVALCGCVCGYVCTAVCVARRRQQAGHHDAATSRTRADERLLHILRRLGGRLHEDEPVLLGERLAFLR